VIKINANHQEKKANEKSNENAERLSKEFMIFINFRVMLIWNMWIKEKFVNDVMKIIVNIIWNDYINNSFKHMSTILLINFDDYNKMTNIKIHEVNVIFVISRINQWKNDDMIYSRIQFSLISVLTILMHKNQKLTLFWMIFNFRRVDDCSRQSYVALSRVRVIEHMTFESRFFLWSFF
jgi:hypothetical protein